MLKKIIIAIVAWKVLILICIGLATFILPINTQYFGGTLVHNYPYWLKVWANFDGYHYLRVASRGYFTFNLPFFPLYPLFIRALIRIPGNSYYLLTGLFVSHLAFFGALYFITQLLKIDKKIQNLTLFLGCLLLFPTSFYYGAVYNDSLFLFFSVLCILFSRKKQWGWASLAGALATLTRLNGLALAVYMAFEYIISDYENIKNTWGVKKFWQNLRLKMNFQELFDSKIWLVMLIPLAYIGFLTYIQLYFGDWRLIHKAMATWDQDKVTFPLQVFWRYMKILVINSPGERTYWVAMIEMCFVLFYIFILWISWKKIRFSYWVLIAVSFIIPALTGTFAGMPRYALHLYPFFLALTVFFETEPRYSRWLYFAISIAIFFLCIAFYTRGYFIA